jgi:hypothetical protein
MMQETRTICLGLLPSSIDSQFRTLGTSNSKQNLRNTKLNSLQIINYKTKHSTYETEASSNAIPCHLVFLVTFVDF